jgi:hypothetical protein
MLDALASETILTGAYSSRGGGVCPMLGVHRRGERVEADAFARAWDRFTGVGPGRGRQATPRELTALRAHLEASLLEGEVAPLAAAIAEHQALARERRAREAAGTGWEWLRDAAPVPPARAARPVPA